MLRVSGYGQKLLAASREGAKSGQQGRAHAIVPADGMQGGALMDILHSDSVEEEVGVRHVAERTNSRLKSYNFWWDETICVRPMIDLTDVDHDCPCTGATAR
jgi:hypothetical protein